jgi:orotate phosphoribosyltransferase
MAPRSDVLELIRARGYERRDEPFQLTSGATSYDYIDGKRAISDGAALRMVAEAVVGVAREAAIDFDAVGGLTMGADPLAHAISLLTAKGWFSVRKERKQHGKEHLVEGSPLSRGTRVLLVDDVITTGKSILQALDAIEALDGVAVVLAVSIVDRGDRAKAELSARGIRYEPLLTYRDLGIEPV